MRSTSKTQNKTAERLDAGLGALSDELLKFVLDAADFMDPMVRDGRIKSRRDFAKKALPAFKRNAFVSATCDSTYAWLVPSVVEAAEWPNAKTLLGYHAEILAGEGINHAARAVLVWAILDVLTERGLKVGE